MNGWSLLSHCVVRRGPERKQTCVVSMNTSFTKLLHTNQLNVFNLLLNHTSL